MNNTHEQEKKQFRRLFQQQSVDRFSLRFQVLEAFLKLEHHVTIKDIQEQLKEDRVELDEGFVLNSMELLCRFGFASKIEFGDKETQYEHRHLGLHHDHMVCIKCGNVLEFKDEAIEKQQLKLADAYGFHMLQHKMEIYGICSKCMEGRTTLVPLHKAKQGEKLIVKEFDAGRNMQLRISSMGLKIGDLIEIVSAGFGGQVVIAVGENRLVLGKGMAEKIRVQPFDRVKIQSHDTHQKSKDISRAPLLLSQMKTGQEGVIRKVTGEGVLRRRLLEMGINRGSTIYVEKYAPLQDPLELVIKGYHISLRVHEAANIFVENVKFKKR
ncbi:MAG: FeoA domain-containing protein [Desulfobacula sp.]|uniref:FeoA domain-containing protein n=1 Tax=Desulfobacula sp. TaxID=2593537 RepID=UPI0025C31D17|nr:FeoA domain-containing protein [Desulfobacula sp.]MCD4719921.1 FeoA domain-containing protein [Desulfobacula sp.]